MRRYAASTDAGWTSAPYGDVEEHPAALCTDDLERGYPSPRGRHALDHPWFRAHLPEADRHDRVRAGASGRLLARFPQSYRYGARVQPVSQRLAVVVE